MLCQRRLRANPSATAVSSAVLAFVCAAATSAPASAQRVGPQHRPSVYLQAAAAEHSSYAATFGITLPWRDWQTSLWGAQVRGYWDLSLSQWASDGAAGHRHTTVVEVTPSFRLVPDAGRSALFLDAGIGATWSSRRYIAQDKAFSTSFNFATHLGVGYAFGDQRQHELQLRLQHVSNGGIKKPNPGENFVQLRYALHF